MITAVDTNILLDLTSQDAHSEASIESLAESRAGGLVLVCDVAYAEFAGGFASQSACDSFLDLMGVEVDGFRRASSYAASQVWRAHLRAGGKRTRILPDFLIGAHAMLQADQLLTRDRGFFREYFPKLKIVDPTKRMK